VLLSGIAFVSGLTVPRYSQKPDPDSLRVDPIPASYQQQTNQLRPVGTSTLSEVGKWVHYVRVFEGTRGT
jgi:hypothetical protein